MKYLLNYIIYHPHLLIRDFFSRNVAFAQKKVGKANNDPKAIILFSLIGLVREDVKKTYFLRTCP